MIWFRSTSDPLGPLIMELVRLEYARHNKPQPTSYTLVDDVIAQLAEWRFQEEDSHEV